MTCTTHHEACQCREAEYTQWKMHAQRLAGAYWRLQKNGCIVTHVGDEQYEPEFDHWRNIADDATQAIRNMSAAKG